MVNESPAPPRPALDATAIAASVTLGALGLAALAASRLTLLIFVAAVCLIAAGELFRIARRLGVVPVPLAGFAGVAAVVALARGGPEKMLFWLPGIVAATAALCFIALVIRRRIQGALSSVSVTVAVVLYSGVLGSFIVAMRQTAFGFRVVLAFAFMVTVNGAAASLIGAVLGRHPMAPSIRPAWTWEGFAAGTLATLGGALGIAWKLDPPFSAGRALVLAAIVVVAVPLGGLAQAALKHDAGVRASGAALAGHGVLDRIDGLLFAAPVFYLAYRAMVR